MTKAESDAEKRVAELKKEVLQRGFNRYPSIVQSVQNLPVELYSPCVARLASGESIQTIIAFPPQIQRGHHYIPKQALLFTSTDMVHLLASIWPSQEPQVTIVRGCGLLYMRIMLLLLYGNLEIVALGSASPSHLGMEFNTMAWTPLSEPLIQILQAARAMPSAPGRETQCSPTARKAIEKLPLKFSNGVKIFGLLPGEQLEDLVFQPAAWKPCLFLLRRQISANTLLLLTTNYVTVIQEELEVGQGWILSYIPREGIAGMQSLPCGQLNELTVQLNRLGQSADFKILLKGGSAEAWRSLWIQHGGRWQDLPGSQGG